MPSVAANPHLVEAGLTRQQLVDPQADPLAGGVRECFATSQGAGSPQVSSPSDTSRTVPRPLSGRSPAALRSESPMGVSPLGSTAATALFIAARSSGCTGSTSDVSSQPCVLPAP